jgi:hypothetical protein
MSNDKTEQQLNELQKRLWERSPAPRLTPEQLNAIDLLILGKTDREVSNLVGVRRETVTKWHRNPFFTAELNCKREALWADSKLRLRALASEAIEVLSDGLHHEDMKIAISAAVHILKTIGLYDTEGKESVKLPTTPEEALWGQVLEDKTKLIKGSRPDALTDWTTKNWAEGVGAELAARTLDMEFEQAVRDQKKELKEFKTRAKAQEGLSQLPQIEVIEMEEEEGEEGQSPNQAQEPEKVTA